MAVMKKVPPRLVLLTGFGPFPGVERNASGLLVRKLAAAAKRRFEVYRFETAILATDWDTGPAKLAAIQTSRSHLLALHFGVSRQARGFVIETVGRNERRDAEDAAGCRPQSSCISEDGPARLFTPLPATGIVARLTVGGLAATTSDDAGGYLCNAIFYQSLAHCSAQNGASRAGFIHIPADLGEPGAELSMDDGVRGGLEILAACLDQRGLSAPAAT